MGKNNKAKIPKKPFGSVCTPTVNIRPVISMAIKCFDHKTKEIVAVKLIRNKKKFQHQAGVELKILQHLK